MIRRIDALRALDAKGLEKGRQALVNLLSRFRQKNRDDITIVFDGQVSSLSTQSGITIRFSKISNKADDTIKNLVDQSKNAREITVVSSDNEIMWYARGCGCKVERSEDFYAAIKDTSNGTVRDLEFKNDPQLSAKEIDEWRKLFHSK